MWEAWDLDSTRGGSSLNHIFKAGGISPYLYEDVLGLSFAMRPVSPDIDNNCPCEASLALPWSASARFGLACPQVAALCSVVRRRRGLGAGGTSISTLFSEINAEFTSAFAEHTSRSAITARTGFTVSFAAAVTLGQASGWRKTPAGNVSFSWNADFNQKSLLVSLQAPVGDSRLELPLELMSSTSRVRVAIDGNGVVEVAVAAREVSVLDVQGEASLWAPVIFPCEGVAAAHVEGSMHRSKARLDCRSVLLLKVPAGHHMLKMYSL
jgi:hypothetical protein